jgi:hypothetical protein
MLRAAGRARRSFFKMAGMQDKQKSPPAKAAEPVVPPMQNGAPSEAGSGADACRGTCAPARGNLGTEFARTLPKIAACAFLDMPFSRSCFELTSCPSTRTWSPEAEWPKSGRKRLAYRTRQTIGARGINRRQCLRRKKNRGSVSSDGARWKLCFERVKCGREWVSRQSTACRDEEYASRVFYQRCELEKVGGG